MGRAVQISLEVEDAYLVKQMVDEIRDTLRPAPGGGCFQTTEHYPRLSLGDCARLKVVAGKFARALTDPARFPATANEAAKTA